MVYCIFAGKSFKHIFWIFEKIEFVFQLLKRLYFFGQQLSRGDGDCFGDDCDGFGDGDDDDASDGGDDVDDSDGDIDFLRQ